MAITAVEYTIFKELKSSGLLPARPTLLELGEANWYGDIQLNQLSDDICNILDDHAVQIKLLEELIATVRAQQPDMPWQIAKIFYRIFLNYRDTVAIDFGGTEQALKLDLNQPVSLGRKFDVVFNGGTGEHVFNVWQFFKTVHDHTAENGLMIHGAPFTGWIDHGFFNFNPTLYWDLAAANQYKIHLFAYTELEPVKFIKIQQREQIIEMVRSGQIGLNSNLYVIFGKPSGQRAFMTPQQGYYANTVSECVKDAWLALR